MPPVDKSRHVHPPVSKHTPVSLGIVILLIGLTTGLAMAWSDLDHDNKQLEKSIARLEKSMIAHMSDRWTKVDDQNQMTAFARANLLKIPPHERIIPIPTTSDGTR